MVIDTSDGQIQHYKIFKSDSNLNVGLEGRDVFQI